MTTKETNIPFNINDEALTTLNSVRFTYREIDIITLIFHARRSNKIAWLLSISTRTVETHMANIMRKMDINSRERIIDFVEKSGQTSWIKKHYQNLLNEIAFKKKLKEISKLVHGQTIVCSLVFEPEEDRNEYFVSALKDYLTLCGVQVVLTESGREPVNLSRHYTTIDHALYVISKTSIEKFQTDKDKFFQIKSNVLKENISHPKSFTFVLQGKNSPSFSEEFLGGYLCIPFEDYEGYSYCSFFEILKRILPEVNLDKIIADFKSKQESEQVIFEGPSHTNLVGSARKKSIFNKKTVILTVLSALLVLFMLKFSELNRKNQMDATLPPSIRSDLVIPTSSTFLERLHIIEQIGKSLNKSGAIQTVAIAGIGGAGKTTIARKYALQQNANIVWEINATTREDLRESFERLAYALCKTEEEKIILMALQNIKNNLEKDQKILLFLKERMKKISDWFLIYDNVENFTDIHNYFPGDSNVWGNGKVIVTTSNSNTKNNNSIHNFILIGELSPQEKLELFVKIMDGENFQGLTADQKEQANAFLNDIPPYPLDISIAAYYLKSTNTPYREYLKKLKENQNDFDLIQANVVKEASGYSKTRYSIITLSARELLAIHKDFQDLLLLISLIGHQNIPKSLLIQYKGHTIVDNFIYHLKKYSLLTSNSSSNSIPTISIHKKTQETILSYLVNTLMLSDKSPLVNAIANTLENYILDAVDKEDFSRMKLLALHGEILLYRDDLLSGTTKSSLKGALGCIYYYLKNYPKIKHFLEENLVDLKCHYGNKHDKIARTLLYLGNFYRSLGDYERAKALLEQSLDICKEISNHSRSAKALGYLGSVHRDVGDYKKAKIFFEQSLVIYEKYSPNSIGHAWILTYLGNIHRILGNYEKARVLLEQSFAIYKEASEDYVGTAWALGYIGTVHRKLGDYQKAKDYIEKALSIYKKHFSDDHIYIAHHMSALAKVYIKIGDYQEAKTILKTSLSIYEKNYGQNHVGTASVLRRLGEAYLLAGDLEASEELINKSLLICQKINSPEIFKSFESLAGLYLKKAAQAKDDGDIKQAQSLNNRVIHYLTHSLKIIKDYFSEDSPHATKIQLKLDALMTPPAVSNPQL